MKRQVQETSAAVSIASPCTFVQKKKQSIQQLKIEWRLTQAKLNTTNVQKMNSCLLQQCEWK